VARDLTKDISQLVKNQFPSFYHEEGEMFIAFVKAYYEWLESNNQALYHSRRLTDYKDIDKTVDDFIIDFKNKYLSDVQFNVATNKRLFVKNALEFYRAKGTPRAVDLFFKLIYGLEARVYEPSRDLFRLSDNEWTNERYLEMLPSDKNVNFVGRQVFGSISGATAFAEKLVRVKTGTKFVEVLYLSGLTDNFVTNELIFAYDIDDSLTDELRNEVVGSLTHFTITASDANFQVGERLYVKTGSGKKAQATVTAIQSAVGVVNFNFIDGGWGYSSDAQIIGSDKTLTVDDLQFTSNAYFYHNFPFEQFTTAKQDLVLYNLETTNSTSTAAALALTVGTEIFATANDVSSANVVWEGIVVDKSIPNSTLTINYTKSAYSGDLTEDGRPISGNNEITFLHANVSGNTESFEIDVTNTNSTDVSIEANVIATSNTCTIRYTTSDTDTNLIAGEQFYQNDPTYGHRFASATVISSEANNDGTHVNLRMDRGYFRTNVTMKRLRNINGVEDIDYTITRCSNVTIGFIAYGGGELNFRQLANTYTSNTQLGTFAPGNSNNVIGSFTSKAAFRASTYDNLEGHTVIKTTDREGNLQEISDIGLDTVIDETANVDVSDPTGSLFEWIHSNNTIEFSNTTLDNALNYSETAVELGEISTFVTTAPGEGYGTDPLFIVYEPLMYHAERYDFYIKYKEEEVEKTYTVGEKLKFGDNEFAKIFAVSTTNREIYATRLHVTQTSNTGIAENLWTTEDPRIGSTFTGLTNGDSAIIEVIDEVRWLPRSGLNTDIESASLSGAGFITDLKILDSGFGYSGKRKDNTLNAYVKGEEMTLASFDDSGKEVQVMGYNLSNGVAPGTHPNRRSFLSSDKYIHDNDFYQEYSYQVLTALPFSKYKSTLVDVLHLAGSKPFGGYVGTSEISLGITTTETSAQFDIRRFGVFVNENTFYSANVT
jgi:hypothetical protein